MTMADGARSDEELARTVTDAGSGPAAAAPSLGDTLGRYRLERMLGQGGMGVVHAAFDPDLERRVALKVLRGGEADEARQRLLREARSMARLTHPNVVTVFEVGSAGGRDYVAMELVDGETLAEWLRAADRSRREIVAAFVAAGRGLAAAHAAGLVHRDFKPHNVLRRRDGRICVTDFGLARGVDVTGTEATAKMPAMSESMQSTLSAVTATGSLVGTPAYMAPEQWSGGTVGPPADQFAFCVALWEALTDERPFRGTTVDELKREIVRGSAGLDASKLPRRLRGALKRGLDPDPAKRWPSMDALLAEIARGERRPTVALAAAGGAVVAAVALYFALGAKRDVCAPPVLDPATVWSAARADALAKADQASGGTAIAADFARWQDVRGRACKDDTPLRASRLACLDGVLASLDLHARALEAVRDAPHADVGGLLVDPAVCEAPRPPRLVATITPQRLIATTEKLAATTRERALESAKADELIAATRDDPCAAVHAYLAAADARRTTVERKRDLDNADGAAQRCGDDRLIAEMAWSLARNAFDRQDPDVTSKLERADAAVATVMQSDLRASIDELRAFLARRADHLDEAISRFEAARDGFRARGRIRAALDAQLQIETLRVIRAKPADLALVSKDLADWHAEAVAKLGGTDQIARDIDTAAGMWQFANGDVAGGHARLVAAYHDLPLERTTRASGRVVDDAGAPVAGATIVASQELAADSVGFLPHRSQRSTTSAADGTFELPEVIVDATLGAELRGRRARPLKVGEHVTLVLEPTSRLEGKVDLRGEAPPNVTIFVRDPAYEQYGLTILAPVSTDGTFAVDGVFRGKMMVHAQVSRLGSGLFAGTPVTIAQDVVRGVVLAVPSSKRTVSVVVRSTIGLPLTRAVVLVMPGQVASTNASELQKSFQNIQQRAAIAIEREHAPPPVLAVAKPGDVFASVPDTPEGVASACAVGFPTEVADPDLDQKILAHLDKLEVRCVPIGEKDQVVVVEVPPWPRFD
jgi:tRNA A-37 threonylcarbamoyl transferase component Bud32